MKPIAALLLAACLCSSSSAALAGPKTVEVSMDTGKMAFLPPVVEIKVGDTVRWTNPASVSHTVSFDPAAAKEAGRVGLPAGVQPFASGPMDQGDSFSHIFAVKGSYSYVCRYHQTMGMLGRVVVR